MPEKQTEKSKHEMIESHLRSNSDFVITKKLFSGVDDRDVNGPYKPFKYDRGVRLNGVEIQSTFFCVAPKIGIYSLEGLNSALATLVPLKPTATKSFTFDGRELGTGALYFDEPVGTLTIERRLGITGVQQNEMREKIFARYHHEFDESGISVMRETVALVDLTTIVLYPDARLAAEGDHGRYPNVKDPTLLEKLRK
jgi:hypothetical protein